MNKENKVTSKPLPSFPKFDITKLCKISKLSTKIMLTSAIFEDLGAKI